MESISCHVSFVFHISRDIAIVICQRLLFLKFASVVKIPKLLIHAKLKQPDCDSKERREGGGEKEIQREIKERKNKKKESEEKKEEKKKGIRSVHEMIVTMEFPFTLQARPKLFLASSSLGLTQALPLSSIAVLTALSPIPNTL